jgi:mRNA interferase MazF
MQTSSYEPFEVVSVPFPFTDKAQTKRRPALLLSSQDFGQRSGHWLLAMITSAKNSSWPLDVVISDIQAAGLPSPSLVRMKLFTLDHRFILRSLGHLNTQDRRAVLKSVKSLLGLTQMHPVER